MTNVLTRLVKSVVPPAFWGTAYRLQSGEALRRFRFKRHSVGDGSYLDPSVQILGADNVRIGRSTLLSQDVWLNVNHRDEGVVRIRIGDSCHIGRNNFFSSGPLIEVGDYFFSGIDCRLLGCGHRVDAPTVPYLASGLSEGAPIVIGTNCWLTTAVTVLEGVTVGRGSVIGAASLVSKSVLPFSMAAGNPCVTFRRFSFRDHAWVDVDSYRASDDGFAPDEPSYRDAIRRSSPDIPPSLLPSGRRFGWI